MKWNLSNQFIEMVRFDKIHRKKCIHFHDFLQTTTVIDVSTMQLVLILWFDWPEEEAMGRRKKNHFPSISQERESNYN